MSQAWGSTPCIRQVAGSPLTMPTFPAPSGVQGRSQFRWPSFTGRSAFPPRFVSGGTSGPAGNVSSAAHRSVGWATALRTGCFGVSARSSSVRPHQSRNAATAARERIRRAASLSAAGRSLISLPVL